MNTPERSIPREYSEHSVRLTQAQKDAEESAKLEERRNQEAFSLGLPKDATWEQIIHEITLLEQKNDAQGKPTEGIISSPKQEVPQKKETFSQDIGAFASRMKEAEVYLTNLVEKVKNNPGFEMAKAMAQWDQMERDLVSYVGKLNYAKGVSDEEEIMRVIEQNMEYFVRIWQASKRLEAYIQPLLNENEPGSIPIRDFISKLKGISVDFESKFRPHGIELDSVEILSPVPQGVEIDYARAEGFLIGGGGDKLPMDEMRKMVLQRQKGTESPIVTDVRSLSYSIGGRKIRKTTVSTYDEIVWLTAMQDSPTFRTQ
ncbi:MAG: hypothetical protein V1848_00840 [Candidatus Magasanikbacteria bacterium]